MSDKTPVPEVGDAYELLHPIPLKDGQPVRAARLVRRPRLKEFKAIARATNEIGQTEKALELLTDIPVAALEALDIADFKNLKRRWIDPLFADGDEGSPESSEDASATQ